MAEKDLEKKAKATEESRQLDEAELETVVGGNDIEDWEPPPERTDSSLSATPPN